VRSIGTISCNGFCEMLTLDFMQMCFSTDSLYMHYISLALQCSGLIVVD
jgi:hypothetical protein